MTRAAIRQIDNGISLRSFSLPSVFFFSFFLSLSLSIYLWAVHYFGYVFFLVAFEAPNGSIHYLSGKAGGVPFSHSPRYVSDFDFHAVHRKRGRSLTKDMAEVDVVFTKNSRTYEKHVNKSLIINANKNRV